jgi:hypothetical protein
VVVAEEEAEEEEEEEADEEAASSIDYNTARPPHLGSCLIQEYRFQYFINKQTVFRAEEFKK